MSDASPPWKVLVTGASRGIGCAIAQALKEEGYAVLGTSRNPDRIREGAEGVTFIPLDLREERSILECARQAGDIDILINNAGQSQVGSVEDIPLEKMREDFQVNFFGTVKLTQALLPRMREKGGGHIINIGSLVGRFPVPFQSSYTASKSALAGFTWSLRNEVRPYGIKVTLLEPYHILTEIEPYMTLTPDSPYRENVLRMKETRDRKMATSQSPEVVARKVLKILGKKKPAPYYSVGGAAPLMVFLKRFIPNRVLARMIRRGFGLD